jgi:hypothetical protein
MLETCNHCGTAYEDDRPGLDYYGFCSPVCESAHYDEARQRHDHPTCALCGAAVSGRYGVTYCSSKCRQKAYRQRRKPTQPAEPAPITEDDSGLVEVYKILVKASEPLTADQIAERVGPGFSSAAMTGYREYKQRTDPAWLKGKGPRWNEADQTEAMVWWVRQKLNDGIEFAGWGPGFFAYANPSADLADVLNGTYQRRETTYAPGDHVPKVRRLVWVCQPVIEDWSLDELIGDNRRHVASMEFLTKLDAYRGRGKRVSAETRELLELAERAIRKGVKTAP